MSSVDLSNYCALALDPIHVGSGRQYLSHVDNPIIREAGTNLPIIPGSGFSGVTRCAVAINTGHYPRCAGKGEDEQDGVPHCGENNCPVCVTFGFSKKKNSSFQGMAQFYDAQILFFPVNSIIGTVWVTTMNKLRYGMPVSFIKSGSADGATPVPATDPGEKASVTQAITEKLRGFPEPKCINLGWLRLPVTSEIIEADKEIKQKKGPTPSEIPEITYIGKHLVLVNEGLFSRIVNSNLEIRTSVAINPKTGAAEDGALFTYEAIPRATIFSFQVGFNDPIHFKINKEPIAINKDNIKNFVTKGLKDLETLGIGGMNTRGMGRIRVWEV